ncbi:MAG: hypothetical protein ABGW78_05290 [Pirellulales bacterium]
MKLMYEHLRQIRNSCCPWLRNIWEYWSWSSRQFAAPSPRYIKWEVLKRNGVKGSTWIETGTYTGDTTAFIGRLASSVISIEPDPVLAHRALRRFQENHKITVYEGTSEAVLPEVLQSVSGDVTFWLDGHWSGEGTYQGVNDTPIHSECQLIASRLSKLENVSIMIDDVRCFEPTQTLFRHYPERQFLVEWARENALSWHIEHDIFVATRKYPIANN